MKEKTAKALSYARALRIELENYRHSESYEDAVKEADTIVEVLEHCQQVSNSIERIVNG